MLSQHQESVSFTFTPELKIRQLCGNLSPKRRPNCDVRQNIVAGLETTITELKTPGPNHPINNLFPEVTRGPETVARLSDFSLANADAAAFVER